MRADYDEELTQDEEFARRVLDEVQHLEPTPEEEEEEKNDDIESEEEERNEEGEHPEEEEEPEEDREEEPKRQSIRDSAVWMFISGNVLLWKGLTRYYGQMIIVAFLFLLSIIVMFWSLHLDMEYTHLSREVQLLRERSVRLQEVHSSRTSHSAIVRELERRKIDLHDPTTPATVIEKSSGLFW